VLQCDAVCCSACGFCQMWFSECVLTNVRYLLLRSDTVCCSVLQCVAVCCSVLQCVAVCCSELQCVAVCCSVLQGRFCICFHPTRCCLFFLSAVEETRCNTLQREGVATSFSLLQ